MNEERIITCIIVEDEPPALRQMEEYVNRTSFLRLQKSYFDAEQLLADLDSMQAPDLIFSDIEMPQINGIELSRRLPAKTRVIFTTAYSRYAIEGFKVRALDYLLKPICYDEFLDAARKALDWFQREDLVLQAGTALPAAEERPSIEVKEDRQAIKIPIDEIVRIEGLKDYVKIYCSDGLMHLVLMRMKAVMELLPEKDFDRVHKSHIVRLSAVESADSKHLVVGGTKIPTSLQYRKKQRGGGDAER